MRTTAPPPKTETHTASLVATMPPSCPPTCTVATTRFDAASIAVTAPEDPPDTQTVPPAAAMPTGWPPTFTAAGARPGTMTVTDRLALERPRLSTEWTEIVCRPGDALNVGLRPHVFARLRSTLQTRRFVPARAVIVRAIGESWIRAARTIGTGGGAATTSGTSTSSS